MNPEIEEALRKGGKEKKAGRSQRAYQIYESILKIDPGHPDANFNLGLLEVEFGSLQKALSFFKKSLKYKSSSSQYWISYIDTLIKLGKLDKAHIILDQFRKKGAKGKELNNLVARVKKLKNDKECNLDITEKRHNVVNVYFQRAVDYQIKGNFHKAIKNYKDAIKLEPNSAEAYANMGVAYQNNGDLNSAIDSYKMAIKIKPDDSDAYSNMGVALKAKGELSAAIESYQKALDINPGHAYSHYNIGNIFKDKGNLEEAINHYKKAIEYRGDYSEAHNNMGLALQGMGDFEGAMESYRQAIKSNPKDAIAHNNMGLIFDSKGRGDDAVESYKNALDLDPNYFEAYYNLANLLRNVYFTRPVPGLADLILKLLEKKTIARPKSLAIAIVSLLKLDSNFKEVLDQNRSGGIEKSLKQVIIKLANIPLFIKLISLCPIPDLEIESLLTNIRSTLLLNLSEISYTEKALTFLSALSLQCFINEYVYSQLDDETESILKLEKDVQLKISQGVNPSPEEIFILSSYKPLITYPWSFSLCVSKELREVVTTQLDELREEEQIRKSISGFQEIEDETSIEVREQYEANPYPRWINLALVDKPLLVRELLQTENLKVSEEGKINWDKPDVLIAGCGTGEHSVATASRIKNSSVLAIDLSLRSLAYATRKSNELNIKNIDYMHADILNARKLNRKFDIVESVGVLHHMSSPKAGWKALVDCLKPGGLMKIGLYSKLARQSVTEVRSEIKKSNLKADPDMMRSFREVLISSMESNHKQITQSLDFYSLSTFRDLLFHAEEHQFSLSQIKEILDELNLKFCGFEGNKLKTEFMLENNTAESLFDLDLWNRFEVRKPYVFSGMYQFWCQKII